MATTGKSIVGYIIAAILIFFGVLFIWAAFTPDNVHPYVSIFKGIVSVTIGLIIIVLIKKNEPKQKIEITQKIELSGSVKPEEMKCKQCGAPLDRNSVEVKEGAVFINCPYCKGTYQITEEPKW